jgi:hypothetical protein
MQGRNENNLTHSDIITAFEDTIKLWGTEVNKGNVDVFPRTAETKE